MAKKRATILYQGPSMLDGSPIVAILTGGPGGRKSKNTKTSTVPQVWILRSDVAPNVATATGSDSAVCGDCPRRPITVKGHRARINATSRGKARAAAHKLVRNCYVEIKVVCAIFRAFVAGSYTELDPAVLRGMFDTIRIGAYGDPAAVPVSVWQNLAAKSGCRILGYTHQWQTVGAVIAPFAMASVETAEERLIAKNLGFRTFRVRWNHEPVQPGEAVCSASRESGLDRTCATCRGCDGTARSARKTDFVIIQH